MKNKKNSKSIKNTLPHITRLMTILFLILIIPMNMYFQLFTLHKTQKENTVGVFRRLEKLVENNEDSLKYSKDDFKKSCIKSADTVAYFVEKSPNILFDTNKTKELARMLGVDEIHYFNEKGEIYGGSHPEYYGFSFNSGSQMGFFKPMLYDKNLKLCQDISPNTAEGKKMQYAAAWTSDGKNIVQVGIEPNHILEIMDEKSLQNTIKMLPMEKSTFLHVIDRNSKKIIASTTGEKGNIGRDASVVLKSDDKKDGSINMSHLKYQNEQYCIYTTYYKDYVLVRSILSRYIARSILKSTFLVLIYVSIVSLGVIGIIKWYVNKKLIKNLTLITKNLKMIEEGDIERLDIDTEISEFDELLSYINHMLDNIRYNWDKLSYIMDEKNIPVGIFERNKFYKKVFINRYLLEILDINESEELSSQELADIVEKKIHEAESSIVDEDENICEFYKNGVKAYMRIDKYVDKQSVTYYITDISSWWSEISELKEKSEIDILTNLYNRRGFHERVRQLFDRKIKLGYSMLIVVDADNLKKINDVYGHNLGDEYIKKIASILDDIELKHISARIGGDEYATFVYGAVSIKELESTLDKIKKRRGEGFIYDNDIIKESVHFSMGVAYYPLDGNSIASLAKIADENMYKDKKNKKERYNRE